MASLCCQTLLHKHRKAVQIAKGRHGANMAAARSREGGSELSLPCQLHLARSQGCPHSLEVNLIAGGKDQHNHLLVGEDGVAAWPLSC